MEGRLKTSLGTRAFGDGDAVRSRRLPAGAPGSGDADRVRRAIDGLGDLIDGYEFHYPQELSEKNLDEVREALGDHDVYRVATGLHLGPRNDGALREAHSRKGAVRLDELVYAALGALE